MQHDAADRGRGRPVAHRGRSRGAAVIAAITAMASLAMTQMPVAEATTRAPATSTSYAAPAGTASSFIASINSLRASRGLAPLEESGELDGVAQAWADQMAGALAISHNPNLASSVSAPWHKLGENVGVGYDVEGLMTAFINSPAHYKNLVDPAFNAVGVGVSHGADGRLYTTHDFMAVDDGGDAPAPDPAPAPQPARHAPPAKADPPPAAPEPTVPAPPPPPPADPARIHAVLTALRAVSD